VPEEFIDSPALITFQIENNNFDYTSALQAQRDALIAFYNSTGGDDWNTNTGWLGAQGTECTWYGVSCFGPYVVELAFGNYNNIDGPLPEQIGDLAFLRKFHIYTGLTGEIPGSI